VLENFKNPVRHSFNGRKRRSFRTPVAGKVERLHVRARPSAVCSPRIRYSRRNVQALDLPGHGSSEGPAFRPLKEWRTGFLKFSSTSKFKSKRNRPFDGLSDRARVRGTSRCRAHRADRHRLSDAGVGSFLEAARKNQHAAFDMDTIWGHAPQVPLAVIRTRACGCTGTRWRACAGSPPASSTTILRACNDYSGGFESAAKVKCPTLFILGRRDVMTPAQVSATNCRQDQGRKASDNRLFRHSLMAEAPDATLDALIGFFA